MDAVLWHWNKKKRFQQHTHTWLFENTANIGVLAQNRQFVVKLVPNPSKLAGNVPNTSQHPVWRLGTKTQGTRENLDHMKIRDYTKIRDYRPGRVMEQIKITWKPPHYLPETPEELFFGISCNNYLLHYLSEIFGNLICNSFRAHSILRVCSAMNALKKFGCYKVWEIIFAQYWIHVVGTRISQLLRIAHAELSRLCATSVARQADGGHVGVLSKFIMPNSAVWQLQDVALSCRTDTPTFGINRSLVALTHIRPQHGLPEKQKNSQSTTSTEALYSQQFVGKNSQCSK